MTQIYHYVNWASAFIELNSTELSSTDQIRYIWSNFQIKEYISFGH